MEMTSDMRPDDLTETDRIVDALVDSRLVRSEMLALFGERAQDITARTREVEGMAWKAFGCSTDEDLQSEEMLDDLRGGTRDVLEAWQALSADIRDYARRLRACAPSAGMPMPGVRQRTREESERVAQTLVPLDLDAVDWLAVIGRVADEARKSEPHAVAPVATARWRFARQA